MGNNLADDVIVEAKERNQDIALLNLIVVDRKGKQVIDSYALFAAEDMNDLQTPKMFIDKLCHQLTLMFLHGDKDWEGACKDPLQCFKQGIPGHPGITAEEQAQLLKEKLEGGASVAK